MFLENYRLVDFDRLWDYKQPEATEENFLDILNSVKMSDNKGLYLELLTQIARAQGLQKKFEQAHDTLDKVKKSLTSNLVSAKIRYLLERGRLYNSSEELKKAKQFFTRAWNLSLKAEQDYYSLDAAHMLAIVEIGNKKIEWNIKALELAEKSNDQRAKKWFGSLYNNIGWAYFDNEDYENALEYFKKAMDFHKINQSLIDYYIAKWTVGRAIRALKNYQEALYIQKNLLAERKEMSLSDDGFIYEEIAECLLELNKVEESKEYFAKAYEILSKDIWLQNKEKIRIDRLQNLSQ